MITNTIQVIILRIDKPIGIVFNTIIPFLLIYFNSECLSSGTAVGIGDGDSVITRSEVSKLYQVAGMPSTSNVSLMVIGRPGATAPDITRLRNVQ